MIIGLTGRNAAGKGEFAAYLRKKGFTYLSLSDEIRKVAAEKSIEPIRENLINLGNSLRKRYGASYLAFRVNKKISKDKEKNYIVDSIRSPAEVKELKKNKDFVLIGVDAPVEIRFERSRKRARQGDAKTLEEFEAMEKKENLKKESGQQLDRCFEMADVYVSNEGSLTELHKIIDDLLKHFKIS